MLIRETHLALSLSIPGSSRDGDAWWVSEWWFHALWSLIYNLTCSGAGDVSSISYHGNVPRKKWWLLWCCNCKKHVSRFGGINQNTQDNPETVVDVLFYSLLRSLSLSPSYFYFLSLGIAYTHMRVLQKSVYFKVWVSFQLYFGLFGFDPIWDVYHMLADEHMSPPLCVLSK